MAALHLPRTQITFGLTGRAGEVLALCAKAIEGHGGYRLSDVMKNIQAGRFHCFAGVRDGAVEFGVITEVVTFPRSRVLWLLFAGGENLDYWFPLALDAVKKHARGQGCRELQAWGRPGWEKYVKSTWRVFRVPV